MTAAICLLCTTAEAGVSVHAVHDDLVIATA